MQTKWFITGGAGFLGINLVRHLLGHIPDVRITTLDIAPFDYPEANHPRLTHIIGDIRDEAAVTRAAQNAQIVVHTAAALPLYSDSDIRTTDIEGTRNTLRAAQNAGAARFIHISSTAVYGIPDHHPLMEDDARVGVGVYGEAKIEAEKMCEAARETGACVSILRPKSFIGPERLGVFGLLYDWADDGHGFPVLGGGRNRYQLLDVEDLCAAIWLCATIPAPRANDTFNIGAAEFGTMREDFQAVLDAAGHNKRISGVPVAPVLAALRILDRLKLSPLYAWVYETAHKDSWVSIEKAQTNLGFSPQYSNRDALLRNFDWYRANRAQFQAQSGVSHRVPWKQGVLGLAKRFF